MQDELDQINGNKMAIENRRFERQKEELKGNAGALAIASQIHAEKVKEINAEKKKESTTKNNATSVKAYEKKSSASVSASASQTSGGNTVTIRFESPTGRQASGSFAQADVTSVIEILKEAAERGLPPTF